MISSSDNQIFHELYISYMIKLIKLIRLIFLFDFIEGKKRLSLIETTNVMATVIWSRLLLQKRKKKRTMEFLFDINIILPLEVTIINGDYRILNNGYTKRISYVVNKFFINCILCIDRWINWHLLLTQSVMLPIE